MAWVAFDRAVRAIEESAATGRSSDGARCATRSTPRCWRRRGTSERGAFTQYYGVDELDASVLLMPSVGFLPADDPRFVSTVERSSGS